jgi:hypothetical protein
LSRETIFRSWRTIALSVCLLEPLLLGGCQQPPASPKTRTAHQVRYQLDWVWDGATKTADGTAWEVTNDLGYRVGVTRGYVTSYSMELVECPKDTAAIPVAGLGRLLWSIVEATAYAGHATGTPNPAAIRPMQVESLTAPTVRQVGAVLLAPQTYCQLHYLVARAGREAPGLPADLDMVDTSLHIDGTYRAPGTTADTPFTLHTSVAYGALFDHTVSSSALMLVDTGSSTTEVTVRRHLGRIFDGVDFVKMTDRMMAGQVLKSLIDHVEVEIEPVNENA